MYRSYLPQKRPRQCLQQRLQPEVGTSPGEEPAAPAGGLAGGKERPQDGLIVALGYRLPW